MPSSLPDRFNATQRKCFVDQGETRSQAACEDDYKRRWGRAIERAIVACGSSKKDASSRMGYGTNQAPISNWITGKETPQMARIAKALGAPFEREFLIAYAEECGVGFRVKRTIEFDEATA